MLGKGTWAHLLRAALVAELWGSAPPEEEEEEKEKKAKGRDYAISHSFMPMLLLHIPIYTEFYTTNFGILYFSRIFIIQELVILVP